MEELFIQYKGRSGKVASVPIDRFPFCIGRGTENDLVLTDQSISYEHAYLRLSSGGVSIVDNRSRTGVLVNRKRVQRDKVLQPGDVLQLGAIELEFMALGSNRFSGGEDANVKYYPSCKTWDPMASFAGHGGAGDDALRPGTQILQYVVKLFLEAPLPEVYEHILNLIERTLPFDRCFLILFEGGSPDQISIVARRVNTEKTGEVIVSRDILRRVARSGESVIVATEDSSYAPSESFIRSGAGTALCVPLTVRGKVTGVIYLDRILHDESLSQRDLEAIGPLAGFVGLKIENVRLLQSHIENQVLVRDLELAKTIHDGLLPHEPVEVEGYELEGFSSSCLQVGGDYFDFLEGGERLTVVLGDVSGKGLSSSLYMAGIRSALHAHVEDGLDLEQLMVRLEKHASKAFRPDYFLTLVVGQLDLLEGRFVYSNAGHLPPLVVTAEGDIEELEATDPAFNIAECEEFHCHEFQLEPGDLLFLYTDGLVEAANSENEFFGLEGLKRVLVENRDLDLPELRQVLLESVEQFTGEENATDDRTLVLLRRSWSDADEVDSQEPVARRPLTL